MTGIGSGHRISGLKRPAHRFVGDETSKTAVTYALVFAVPRRRRRSQSSKRMSEPAVGLMVPSTRQNGTDNETNCGGTCAMMLNGGLILPAAVTEASPIFMPARLLQLAASACPVPNQWKASQTKAAAVVRCADRMVSLPQTSSTKFFG